MKKYIFLAATVLISFFAACNGADDKKDDTAKIETLTDDEATYQFNSFDSTEVNADDFCLLAGGAKKFIVEEAFARPMLTRFDYMFKIDDGGKLITSLENNYWIDSCTIFRMADAITSNQYDGFRVYFGCEEIPSSYPGEQYPHKSTIFFFPTKSRISIDPKTISTHGDSMTVIPTNNCTPNDYIKDSVFANPKIRKFKEIFRKNGGKDSLSISVWIDACVIIALKKFIKDNAAKNIDGANFKLAAYEKLDSKLRPSQKYPNQSTIIIVPTKTNATGVHDDDWAIIKSFYKYITIKRIIPMVAGAVNHGELCPQICN